MARRRKRQDYSTCNGCQEDQIIKHKTLGLCSSCQSWLYRQAKRILEDGPSAYEQYYARYVEKPALRCESLYDGGVVEEKRAAREARLADTRRSRRRAS